MRFLPKSICLLACLLSLSAMGQSELKPRWEWAKIMATPGEETVNDMVIDTVNNWLYFVGSYEDSIASGSLFPDTIHGFGGRDGFVAKFDLATETMAWVIALGSRFEDDCKAVDFDNNGDIYVVGFYSDTLKKRHPPQPDQFVLNPKSAGADNDAFLVKLDSTGALVWARSGGGAANDKALAVDAGIDLVAVTGFYTGGVSVEFEGLFPASPFLEGNMNFFAIAFDGNGMRKSALLGASDSSSCVVGDGVQYGTGIFLDESNRMHTLLNYTECETLAFYPSFGFPNFTGFTDHNGELDFAVIRVNANNPIPDLNIKTIGGAEEDVGYSITGDKNGKSIYFTGKITDLVEFDIDNPDDTLNRIGERAFVSKYDSEAGQFIWAKDFPSEIGADIGGSGTGRNLFVDNNENITLAGHFQRMMVIGELDTLVSETEQNDNGFVMQLDSLGNPLWTQEIRGLKAERIYAIAEAPNGSIYTGGFWNDTTNFDAIEIVNNAIPSNDNAFLAKLGCSNARGINRDTLLCVDDTLTILLEQFYGDRFVLEIDTIGGFAAIDTIEVNAEQHPYFDHIVTPDTNFLRIMAYSERGADGDIPCGAVASDTLELVGKRPPMLNILQPQDGISYCASDTLILSADTNGLTFYEWLPIAGLAIADSSSDSTYALVPTPGTYEIKWSGSNEVCPSDTISVEITIDETVTAVVTQTSLEACQGSDVTLTAVSPGAGVTGVWTYPILSGLDFDDINDPTSTVLPNDSGSFELNWTVSNESCADSQTVHLKVDENIPAALVDNITTDTICWNTPYELPALEIEDSVSGLWSSLNPQITFTYDTLYNTLVDNIPPGTSELQWKVTNGACVDSIPLTIESDTIVQAKIDNNEPGDLKLICVGFERSISAENGEIPEKWQGTWTSLNFDALSFDTTNMNETSINILANAAPDTVPIVWEVHSFTCEESTYDTVYFSLLPALEELDAGPDQFLEFTFETTMAAEANPGQSFVQWELISGQGTIAEVDNPITEVTDLGVGTNIFRWRRFNDVCDEVFKDVIIEVSDVSVPSGFSPNGDGTNDAFEIGGIENTWPNELRVFNRWGNEVYTQFNYHNTWSGMSNDGRELPEDTYFYVLKTAQGRALNGYIVLKR